jgi:hypothetical protein
MPFHPLYVDPTAAGLGLQMFLAGIVGALVAVKVFWGRVFSVFRRSRPEEEETSANDEEGRGAVEEEALPHR